MVGAKADGVAEVIDGQPGHHGVQVDDAQGLTGFLIHKDVVQLGVVVGDPQGKHPVPQRLEGGGAVLLPGQHEVDIRLAVLGPAQRIGGHGVLQVLKPVFRVMEAGDGHVEGVGGVVPQQPLEAAEGPAGGGKQLRRLGGLIAHRPLHKGEGPPYAALAVGDAGAAVPGADDGQGLPVGVAAQLFDLPAQVLGDVDDVLHQLLGLLKGHGADALDDHPPAAPILPADVHPEGVVDVALSKAVGLLHAAAEVIGRQHFPQGLLCLYHAHILYLLGG